MTIVDSMDLCGVKRGRESKTTCYLPPDHVVNGQVRERHIGFDTSNRRQSWPVVRDVPPKWKGGGALLRTEVERDEQVRKVSCPNCGVRPPYQCSVLDDSNRRCLMSVSHTGRYLVAVDAGLVPQMAGWPWTG